MDRVRDAALRAVFEIEKNGAYSNIAVKKELEGQHDFSTRDISFFTSLVYGVIDKRLTLEYAIRQYSKIKRNKISDNIFLILKLGIYQILFMDRIPDSAAVNESVKLARRYGHAASAGFVNGVLRNVSRNGIKYPQDKRKSLSIRYSYPEWIIDKWCADFGEEFTEELLGAFEKSARLVLRPNTLKISAEELAKKLSEREPEINDGAVYVKGFDIESDRFFKDGLYSVQGEAAQNASRVLMPRPGDTVIDMCAAPGGKTGHMAEIMENKGIIRAFDIYEHKLEIVRKNAERLGIAIIRTELRDATEYFPELCDSADRVLCDVPCSGMGIIGRKPEIKYAGRSSLDELTGRQLKILKNAARYVKRGGTVVYSTCSINHEENEDIVTRFLSDNIGFSKELEKTYYPNVDKTDGFYICRLTRTE